MLYPNGHFVARDNDNRPVIVIPSTMTAERGMLFVTRGRILNVTPDDGPAGPDCAWVEIEWPDGSRESLAVDADAWDTAAGHRTL